MLSLANTDGSRAGYDWNGHGVISVNKSTAYRFVVNTAIGYHCRHEAAVVRPVYVINGRQLRINSVFTNVAAFVTSTVGTYADDDILYLRPSN